MIAWRGLIGAGLAAVVVVIIGFFIDPREVAAAFLVAYLGTVSTVLGVLAMIMIAHLSNAMWFEPFRARAEAIVSSLPALAVLGVFLLASLIDLYPWVHTLPAAHAYLNVPFFIVRFVIYWAAWIAIGARVRLTNVIETGSDAARATRRLRIVSSGGLVTLAFTMTFAAFDWMMSLTPDWHSTIYAVYWFAGGMVSALAVLALFVLPRTPGYTLERMTPDHLHALGKLLLTFVLFWLYIGFAQYIVIWSGDLPSEVSWYVARTRGGWGSVAAVLLFCNFAFPFLFLLIRFVKRHALPMAIIAGALLCLHYLDTLWIVMPGLISVTWWTALLTIAMIVLFVGVSTGVALREQR